MAEVLKNQGLIHKHTYIYIYLHLTLFFSLLEKKQPIFKSMGQMFLQHHSLKLFSSLGGMQHLMLCYNLGDNVFFSSSNV